jgi:peptidoglycan/LPS O-acetylase OafA/YrhL|tara:strand:- start:206 stop:2239 length:2034 start_codon:yes stop_codon:yes gene_type:complete
LRNIKKLIYRPEIDGLRAIAVLAVIMFHAGIEVLSGGFIGVDIFFVISGYLITAIIIKSLDSQQFSYLNFYARRAKRLLPAALVMILTTVLFSALILSPDKYYQLAKSAEFSNLFIANIWFMKHSGYFDISTQISPLIHMWSLSVEEQFYFIYPFILVCAYKIGKIKAIYWSIITIVLVTFILNLSLVNIHPNFTFYMLPTRAWELGLGALTYFLPQLKNDRFNTILSIVGMAAIFYALLLITEHDQYPGYLATIPTLSAALLIFSLHGKNNIIRKTLAIKPMVFIGKISYSSYLWHWPIIVFYRIYINERTFNATEVIILIISSLIAGYFSWKYIENRYRYLEFSSKKILKVAGYAIVTSVLLTSTVLVSKGFPIRVSAELAAISNNNLMRSLPCIEQIEPFQNIDEKFCVVGAPWNEAKKKGIVWGDSHSLHWGQLLHKQAESKGISLVIAPRKCPAYLNNKYINSHYPKYPNFSEHCTFRNQQTLNWLKKNKEVNLVILAASWSGQVRMHYNIEHQQNKSNTNLTQRHPEIGADIAQVAFKHLLSQLIDRNVLLISDIPRPNKNLNECAFSESTQLLRNKCTDDKYRYLDSQETLFWHESSDDLIRNMADQFLNVSAIIPNDFLCEDQQCQTYINNELIYRDDNHIRSNLKAVTADKLADKLTLTTFFDSLTYH